MLLSSGKGQDKRFILKNLSLRMVVYLKHFFMMPTFSRRLGVKIVLNIVYPQTGREAEYSNDCF